MPLLEYGAQERQNNAIPQSTFGILSVVAAGLLLHIFKETSWAIFVERILEEAAHSLGIERAAMIATLSQILLGGGVLWAALYLAFRVGKAERPIPSDPAIEAARAHTEALREQTAAYLRGSKVSQNASSDGPLVLAGIANAIMERVLQHGFKMTAVQPSDPFIQHYQNMKESTDPIWIDDEIARLRRDFLQYCAIVGTDERSVKELQSDRAELSKFGKQLIDKLMGAGKTVWKPTQSWQELERRFQELEPALQYTRIDGQTGGAGEYWRMAGNSARDAEDRFKAVARMASAKLFQEMQDEVAQYNELASESDPLIRWYKALQHIGGRYESSGFVAREVNDDGSPGHFIYTGSINRPAAASATLCLALASRS